jgi:2-oxo-3-hexenedioate decarboxylase/2-keto-4-pentenoate hydratase
MNREAISDAARRLSIGRLDPAPMSVLPLELRPTSETEAYAVQSALHAQLSDAGRGDVVGHKIGCTTPIMQEFLGIPNPCAGGIFRPTVYNLNCEVGHGDYLHVGVECEIAVRLTDDLTVSAQGHSVESVAPAVESVMAAIEIVDDRWIDYPSVDTPTLIADDFFGAGCVLGDPVTDWASLDLQAISGGMSINGESVGSGAGADIMGHPFAALAWLANAMNDRQDYLRAGEFVLLGSIVATKWVEAGDLVEIGIAGLGAASANFA